MDKTFQTKASTLSSLMIEETNNDKGIEQLNPEYLPANEPFIDIVDLSKNNVVCNVISRYKDKGINIRRLGDNHLEKCQESNNTIVESSNLAAELIAKKTNENAFPYISIHDVKTKKTQGLLSALLERDSLAPVFAHRKHKSLAAMDIALSIATGRYWGRNKTKQGPVFYIAGEGLNGLAKRKSAWTKENESLINNCFQKCRTLLYIERYRNRSRISYKGRINPDPSQTDNLFVSHGSENLYKKLIRKKLIP